MSDNTWTRSVIWALGLFWLPISISSQASPAGDSSFCAAALDADRVTDPVAIGYCVGYLNGARHTGAALGRVCVPQAADESGSWISEVIEVHFGVEASGQLTHSPGLSRNAETLAENAKALADQMAVQAKAFSARSQDLLSAERRLAELRLAAEAPESSRSERKRAARDFNALNTGALRLKQMSDAMSEGIGQTDRAIQAVRRAQGFVSSVDQHVKSISLNELMEELPPGGDGILQTLETLYPCE
jgi:hypothetical protein|tara:strand:+ start:3331 stop:4065 length:735 start_codon:yes stop_codon:yes gene_type:complete